jgi:hypothetical protein
LSDRWNASINIGDICQVAVMLVLSIKNQVQSHLIKITWQKTDGAALLNLFKSLLLTLEIRANLNDAI